MFLLGFFVKFTDILADTKSAKKRRLRIATGIIYGIIIGLLVGINKTIAPLVLGTVIGNMFFGKFDEKAHYAALGATIISIILSVNFFGTKEISIPLTALFAVFSFTDEFVAEKWKKAGKKIKLLSLTHRPVMPIAALVVSILFNEWIFFITIVAFDIAYNATAKYLEPDKNLQA